MTQQADECEADGAGDEQNVEPFSAPMHGLGGEICVACGAEAGGMRDFVSAMATDGHKGCFRVDGPADGEEDKSQRPKRNEAGEAGQKEDACQTAAAAGADFPCYAIGVDLLGVHGAEV